MEFESDGKLSEFLTKQSTGLTSSQVKDVVIGIGTKPGPMNLPSFDEYLENIMTVDKQIYEDMLNMRKKMIMEKVKERRIMKGKKEGYNYKVEEVKEILGVCISSVRCILKKVKRLILINLYTMSIMIYSSKLACGVRVALLVRLGIPFNSFYIIFLRATSVIVTITNIILRRFMSAFCSKQEQ